MVVLLFLIPHYAWVDKKGGGVMYIGIQNMGL